jgi:hypothetical protein
MTFFPSRHKQQPTLSVQIRAAERRISSRQRQIGMDTATITQKIGRQLSAPPNLLLAGGIGFIIGELTKQSPTTDGNGKDGPANKTTPFKRALNLFSSLQTLYTALPLVLMMASAYETKTAKPIPEQSPRASTDPLTTANSRIN